MTTTVTYKGSTLTTVDNQTRTLLTSGKYMEDDVTLTDVTSGGGNISSLIVTPSAEQQVFEGLGKGDSLFTQSSWVAAPSSSKTVSLSETLIEGNTYYLEYDISYHDTMYIEYSLGSGLVEFECSSSRTTIVDEAAQIYGSSIGFFISISTTELRYGLTNIPSSYDDLSISFTIYEQSQVLDGYLPVTVNSSRSSISKKCTCTLTNNIRYEQSGGGSVNYNDVNYSASGNTFSYTAGEDMLINWGGNGYTARVYYNGVLIAEVFDDIVYRTFSLPASDIDISASNANLYITTKPIRSYVDFIDYDGTVLYSYSKGEALALESLPSNPSHSGLVSQGWNWSLVDIKSQLTNIGGYVCVGQMYITQSGDTEVDVEFVDSSRLSPYLRLAVNGTATVDWGDNTTPSTVTGSSLSTGLNVQHAYPTVGKYTMVIHVVSGSVAFYASSGMYFLHNNSNTTSANRIYSSCVRAVRLGSLGSNTTLTSGSFYNCTSLESVTIPKTITSIASNYAFSGCYTLKSITIPNTVTELPNMMCSYCEGLISVSIPYGVTTIGNNTFSSCYSLSLLTVPENVTSLLGNSFSSCHSLKSVILPDDITDLPLSTFNECNTLRSVNIPSSTTSIGNYVFGSCYCLASITIPSSVTSIGDSAFRYGYGTAEYHVKPTTPPTLGATVFANIQSNCKIYVPSASLNTYKTAAGWSDYASYMVGE